MPGHYDAVTVLFSFLIASLSGFVAFESAAHTRQSVRPGFWTVIGGFTLGLGIWSMHFVGMLAWKPPYPLYYSLPRTCWSVMLAVAASMIAMHLSMLPLETRARNKMLGALLVGLGITVMHYLGMSALRFTEPVMWNRGWIAVSVAIAVGASWVALHLLEGTSNASRVTASGMRRQVYASLLVGAAICGMHYAGMEAMMLPEGSVCLRTAGSSSGPALARVGVGNALLLTLCLLIVSYYDKARWAELASEARFQAQEAARDAERLAAAGKIAALIAHEVNNPLAAVTNLLYLIEAGELSEEQQTYLSLAQSEVKRIAEITTHTLKFYRQQSAPEQTSIGDLFESALVLFQQRMEACGIGLQKNWPEEAPTVLCRAGEMRQVLANLVGNAIDSMREGGTLRLGIEPRGDGIVIEVGDTGIGILPEAQAHLFEPFFTTKGPAGTGLGLSISSEIVERHGGTLTFTSSTQKGASGTVFRVWLPAPAEAAPAAEMHEGLSLSAAALA